jgi:hypothetical protein
LSIAFTRSSSSFRNGPEYPLPVANARYRAAPPLDTFLVNLREPEYAASRWGRAPRASAALMP